MSDYSTLCGNCGLPTLIDIAIVQCGECGTILCVDCRQTRHCEPTGIFIPVRADNTILLSENEQRDAMTEPLKTLRMGKLQRTARNNL